MRYARVVAGRGSTTMREIVALLPKNYRVVGVSGPRVYLAGEDVAGWDLEGYVLPRLETAMVYGDEVGREVVPAAFRVDTDPDLDKHGERETRGLPPRTDEDYNEDGTLIEDPRQVDADLLHEPATPEEHGAGGGDPDDGWL